MTEKTKRRILLSIIVVSVLPAMLLMRFPSLVSLKTVSLYLSAIFGYVGIVVLLWSYILGAKSVAGVFFKDIAPVLTIHKWLGKYGTIAILLHPLLVMYSYGESLLYTVWPQLSTQFERHVTLGRIAFVLVLITWIVSAFLRGRIAFRPWRYLHLLGYIILPFAFLHIPDVGSQFMAHEIVKTYYFVLAIVFAVFTLLKIRGLLNIDKSPYVIVSQSQISAQDPSVYLLKLRPVRESIAPTPGQYVYLKDGAISEEHPFSVLNYDPATGEIMIAYRTFGRFTKELAKRGPGAIIWVAGPFGTFTSDIHSNNDKPIVFVAGGIGVTPMVKHIFSDTGNEQWLFYANRTNDSAILVPELRKRLGTKLVTIFSRQADGLQTNAETGRIDSALLQKYLANPTDYRYYLCGSEQMMASVKQQLEALGVEKSQINSEEFSW